MFATALGIVYLATLVAQNVEPLTAAGPRTGIVYEVEVTFANASKLQALTNSNYNVSHVIPPSTAIVYATPAELDTLRQSGYTLRIIREQPSADSKHRGVYHSYDEITAELQAFADAYPDIMRLTSLGQTLQGRELWAAHITDNPDVEEEEPEFKYVGTMHGDEVVGTEMLLFLIERLLTDYNVDPRITVLLNETDLWVVPLMNPDGYELGRRANARGFDLNRSFPAFPTHFTATFYDGGALALEGRQLEVQHIAQWTLDNAFVLSANTHGGALVVNYPYDHEVGIPSSVPAISPDEALFRELSLRYSRENIPMFNSPFFSEGVTNGSAWFAAIGTMQDWNYRYAGCFEVTLELSNIKTPAESTLPQFWQDNEEALLRYLEGVHLGVRGVVTNRTDGAPQWARVSVEGNDQPVFTDPDVGDYYRLLLPGTYTLTFRAPGLIAWAEPAVTVVGQVATRLDIALSNGDVNADDRVTASDIQVVINGLLTNATDPNLDVNGGGLSSTDVQAVVNAALGMPLPGS